MIPKAEKTALTSLKIKIQRQSWSQDLMNSEYFIEDNHITKLKLIESNLTTLPESFGNLKNLQELKLVGNKLTKLPKSFGNLKNLSILELNIHNLPSLPENFGNLVNLRMLKLYGNNLPSLPENFGNLVNLRYLVIMAKNLTSLPENFGNLKNISMLELDGCSLRNLCNISLNCFKHHHRFAIFNLTSKGQSLYSSRNYEELLSYYKKTPSDLAQQYINAPDSLKVDEKERLIHEGGNLEKKILELKMPPYDPILKKIIEHLDQYVDLLNGFKLTL